MIGIEVKTTRLETIVHIFNGAANMPHRQLDLELMLVYIENRIITSHFF